VAYRLLGHEQDRARRGSGGPAQGISGLGDFDGRCGFRTWLLKIVTNTALDGTGGASGAACKFGDGERNRGDRSPDDPHGGCASKTSAGPRPALKPPDSHDPNHFRPCSLSWDELARKSPRPRASDRHGDEPGFHAAREKLQAVSTGPA